MKIYQSTKPGKAEFVKEVLSPLIYQADTGWGGAEYEYDENNKEEYVYLITLDGERATRIRVSGDSLEALVRDTFRNL